MKATQIQNVYKNKKCICTRRDDGNWKIVQDITDSFLNAKMRLGSASCYQNSHIRVLTDSVVFRDWDGTHPIVFDMPSDWSWYGKTVTFAVATYKMSLEF